MLFLVTVLSSIESQTTFAINRDIKCHFTKSIKRNKRNMRKSKNQTRKQKGGKSPSCMVKPDVSKYVKNSSHTANLHNTSPEVDYSLITDTGMSGGSVKPVTFSSYVSKVADKLGITNVEGSYYKLTTDIKKDLFVLIPSISNSFKYRIILLIHSVLLEPFEIIFAIIGS